MIRDFAEFDDGATVAADICIVGSGAAGITMAREFIGTHFSVLMLEGGGLEADAETQKLYESEVVGLPHTGVHEGRARVFGGTTTLWGGQALRLDAFDLQKRTWVPYSGWPISHDELEPFYDRADRVLQLGPRISYRELCAMFGLPAPGFDPARLYMECSQWSPKPNFGTTYRQEIKSASNVSVLLHANVTSIVTNDSAVTVEKIEFRTLTGKQGTAKARVYVICCGGIETARLLLASDRVEPQGLGNKHDLVGRFFQEHIHIRFGDLLTNERTHLQNYFESFYRNRLKYFPLIALSPRVQAEKHLLSVHGSAMFDDAQNSGIVALKQLFRILNRGTKGGPGDLRRYVRDALTSPRDLWQLGYRFYIKERSGTPRRGPIFIGAQAEIAPNPDSRITLSKARDRLGMRKLKLDWRIGELERRTLCEYIRTVASEFERLALGSFDLSQVAFLNDPVAWVRMAHDSAHHMGTTRMHESPQEGVVDPDCRVHGVDNLYIGSSAVFPTSARSNPTLTILALCLRMADRFKGVLA
ncbi:MAG TPA: GMC family oxidoreductase [Candidatus Dormibacteraeota bacterium]|nr:GMC family oxidoreductase [Candidatus Dormibacteraeota bacterium]